MVYIKFSRFLIFLDNNIYIYKIHHGNEKVFRRMDVDPNHVQRHAETEALVWEQTQSEEPLSSLNDGGQRMGPPDYTGLKCYTNGSRKKSDTYSGLGWYAFQGEDAVIMMGVQNVRRSISPLLSEIEALIWAMHCLRYPQKTEVAFA